MLFWQPWFLDQWHYRCNMGITFKTFPLHQQILHLLLCSAVLTSSLFMSPNSALGSFIRGHVSLNCILSDNINPFCCFHKVCYRWLLLTSCILNFYLFFLHQAQQMLCFSGSVNILCDNSSDAIWVSVPIKFAVWKSSPTVCDATTSFIFIQEISWQPLTWFIIRITSSHSISSVEKIQTVFASWPNMQQSFHRNILASQCNPWIL